MGAWNDLQVVLLTVEQVMVPLGKIGRVNPVIMKENSSEKYIQIVTIDGYDFWLMGFVNYDKAVKHLSEAISHFVVPGIAVPSSSSWLLIQSYLLHTSVVGYDA